MINDDTLILYYGNELDDSVRRTVAQALEHDPALAQRYSALVADLERLTDAPLPPVPESASTAWHQVIAHAAARQPFNRKPWWTPAVAAAAGAGVLAIGIAIGVRFGTPHEPASAPQVAVTAPETTAPTTRVAPMAVQPRQQPAFSRGLVSYMQVSREKLIELESIDEFSRTAVIAEIIAHNRAFERVAKGNGAHDIARVLRAFDQILQELADDSATPAERDRGIEQLSFEYGAMLTRMAPRSSKQPYTL